MAKVKLNGFLMELVMKESSLIIKLMEMELITFQTVKYILENLKMDTCMEWESLLGLMVKFMRETITKEKNKELES